MKKTGKVQCKNIQKWRATVLAAVASLSIFAVAGATGLPVGFERLPYIGSTGTQYIKTGVVPNGAKVTVDVRYRITEGSEEKYAFGCYDNNTGAGYGTAVGIWQSKVRCRVYKSAYSGMAADVSPHDVVLNAAAGTTIDGIVASTELAGVTDSGTMEYYVFGRSYRANGDVVPQCAAHVRIYRLAITLNGEPTRDFVPCRRTSDSALGLYDLVHGHFYGNDGEGAFEAPISETEFKRDYQRVKFIENESDGKGGFSYVDTGVWPDGRVPQVDVTYQLLSSSVTASSYVFGYWDSNAQKGTAIGYEPGADKGGRYRVSETAAYYGAPDTVMHTVSLNGPEGTKVDGKVVLPEIRGLQDDGALEYRIFARSVTTEMAAHSAVCRIFALSIRQDGELVRDLVPCVRLADGEAGFFDRVGREFYGNAGACKLHCGYDESELVVLPYIESTGSQYIKTGVTPNGARVTADVKYQFTKMQDNVFAFGYYSDADGGYGTAVGMYNNQIRYRVNKSAYYYGTADLDAHEVLLNDVGGTTIDGHMASTELANITDPGTLEYYAFGRICESSGKIRADLPQGVRIYHLAFALNGQPTRNFVPVLTPGGQAGLFDRVTHRLYENSGSGEFVVPSLFPVSASKIQRLEYVESTGLQYIDTGVAPKGRVPVVRMRYQMTNKTNDKYAFGCWDSSQGSGTLVGLNNDANRLRVNGAGGFYGTANTNQHTVVINAKAGTFLDGELIDSDLAGVADVATDQTYHLFGIGYNNKLACARIYSFVLELDGEKVLDLIPVQIKGCGQVGMWDRRTENFYLPQGGRLLAGPLVKSGFMVFVK